MNRLFAGLVCGLVLLGCLSGCGPEGKQGDPEVQEKIEEQGAKIHSQANQANPTTAPKDGSQ